MVFTKGYVPHFSLALSGLPEVKILYTYEWVNLGCVLPQTGQIKYLAKRGMCQNGLKVT